MDLPPFPWELFHMLTNLTIRKLFPGSQPEFSFLISSITLAIHHYQCAKHFLTLSGVYTFQIFVVCYHIPLPSFTCLILLIFPLNSFPPGSFVALLWTLSNLSISSSSWGTQKWMQSSNCSHARATEREPILLSHDMRPVCMQNKLALAFFPPAISHGVFISHSFLNISHMYCRRYRW